MKPIGFLVRAVPGDFTRYTLDPFELQTLIQQHLLNLFASFTTGPKPYVRVLIPLAAIQDYAVIAMLGESTRFTKDDEQTRKMVQLHLTNLFQNFTTGPAPMVFVEWAQFTNGEPPPTDWPSPIYDQPVRNLFQPLA